jgi:hypothetical protein
MMDGGAAGRELKKVFRLLVAALVFLLAAVFVLSFSGCSAARIAAQSAEPVEATFADPEAVMLRGIEDTTIKAEYWDSSTQAIKVKKWLVRPPFWVVNEAAIKARKASGSATVSGAADGVSSTEVKSVNPKGEQK